MASGQDIELGQREPLKRAPDFWTIIFSNLCDIKDDGEDEIDSASQVIDLRKLCNYLQNATPIELEKRTRLSRFRLTYLAGQLKSKADKNNDGKISKAEWEAWVAKNGKEFMDDSFAGSILRVIAYSPTYSCSPPTVFIISISVLQVIFYLISLYSPSTLNISHSYDSNRWLICSYLIYDPYRRREAWRFITYMFMHGSHQHISMNIIMQLFVGIPLEMSQPGWIGCLRIFWLYMAGVILGSLAVSVINPNNYLVGASAGVYALIAAHLATLILNWHEDGIVYNHLKSNQKDTNAPKGLNPVIRGLRLTFVILFVVIDVGQILYTTYIVKRTTSTSNIGHAFGALAGILIGVFALENRKVEEWEKIFKWIAFVSFGLLLCVFIAWHLVGSQTGWFPAEEWEETPFCKIDS